MGNRLARNVIEIAELLKNTYGDFGHYNRKNPLDELLFIICSVRTSEKNYQNTYKLLRKEFPSFSMLAEASAEYIAKPLATGGLQNQKSIAVKKIISAIVDKFGKPTLAPLKQLSDEDCEKFLTSLPGVGKKVARCIMIYSLNRKVFPVDTHCWRICCRIGWTRAKKRGICTPEDMDRLQNKIPPDLRYSLHVNMVSLGRKVCTASKPKCQQCPVSEYCKKAGVKNKL